MLYGSLSIVSYYKYNYVFRKEKDKKGQADYAEFKRKDKDDVKEQTIQVRMRQPSNVFSSSCLYSVDD